MRMTAFEALSNLQKPSRYINQIPLGTKVQTRVGVRENLEISSTALTISEEFVSRTWPPKISSSKIVCTCEIFRSVNS